MNSSYLVRFIALIATLVAGASLARAADLPAFPGAEGFGATTPGGRGGKVIFVTNLDDAGPGSFRAACEAEGPRIVVFRVSGTIRLKKTLTVRNPYLTIAGQTAPGDGICLRDFTFGIATHDVIVRYIRCRLGDESAQEADALDVLHTSKDVIIDHCSATWSIDSACRSPATTRTSPCNGASSASRCARASTPRVRTATVRSRGRTAR